MKLSNVKMVVTDMDGTLLNPNHEVSPLFFKQFEALKKHNIIFVVATGRPLYSVLDKLKSIKDEIIIVAENGGLVVQNDQKLLSTPIKKDNLKHINKILKTLLEANTLYCTQNKAYTKSKSKKLLDLLEEYYNSYEVITNIDDIEEPIYKIAIYHEISSEKHLYPHLKQLENSFKVKVSTNHWVDISENNANKGYAIELLQKKLGFSKEETMAFGDYNNDIEMLKTAYFSYAMENAHPLVKKTANFITKSNTDFGVEYILNQLVKEKTK